MSSSGSSGVFTIEAKLDVVEEACRAIHAEARRVAHLAQLQAEALRAGIPETLAEYFEAEQAANDFSAARGGARWETWSDALKAEHMKISDRAREARVRLHALYLALRPAQADSGTVRAATGTDR